MTDWEQARYEEAKQAYSALMKFYPFTLENLDGEQWADIKGYEGLYQVSTFGRVKSFSKNKAKIMKPSVNTHGYLFCTLYQNQKSKRMSVHRLVAFAFITNSASKTQVDHINGMRFNNHVSNLRWVSAIENVNAAFQLGIQKSGVESHKAKLTNEQVVFIRDNIGGLSCSQLAEKFNVSQSCISDAQLGKTFKDSGGTLRKSKHPPISDTIRLEICQLFAKGDKSFRALALEFGICHETVRKIILKSQLDYIARPARPRISDELKKQIRTEYIKGSKEFGCYGLAKKYGIGSMTVWNIVNEN